MMPCPAITVQQAIRQQARATPRSGPGGPAPRVRQRRRSPAAAPGSASARCPRFRRREAGDLAKMGRRWRSPGHAGPASTLRHGRPCRQVTVSRGSGRGGRWVPSPFAVEVAEPESSSAEAHGQPGRGAWTWASRSFAVTSGEPRMPQRPTAWNAGQDPGAAISGRLAHAARTSSASRDPKPRAKVARGPSQGPRCPRRLPPKGSRLVSDRPDVVEDLAVKNVLRNRLARAIADCGWRTSACWTGRALIVIEVVPSQAGSARISWLRYLDRGTGARPAVRHDRDSTPRRTSWRQVVP